MNITVIASAAGILADFADGYEKLMEKYTADIAIHLFEVKTELNAAKKEHLEESLQQTDILLLDLRLCSDEIMQKVAETIQPYAASIDCLPFTYPDKHIGSFFKFGELTGQEFTGYIKEAHLHPSLFPLTNQKVAGMLLGVVAEEHKQDVAELIDFVNYWTYANEDHLEQLILLLARKYDMGCREVLPEPKAPMIAKEPVIYEQETKEMFETLATYREKHPLDPTKPVIGFMYLGYNFRASQLQCVAEIGERLSEFANVVPIFVPGVTSIAVERLQGLVMDQDIQIDLLMNVVPFRIGAGPMGGNSAGIVPFLEELGVPIMHPFFLTNKTAKEWQNAVRGVESGEYLVNVMLPELDGSIDSFPIGAMEQVDAANGYDFQEERLVLIEERVNRLIGRARKLLNLQQLENKQKKVAIIGYNYPPGEDSIFGGSFLDTFASITNMLKLLHDNGYNVPAVSKKELMDTFTAGKLLNSGKWSGDVYEGMERYPVSRYLSYMNGKPFYDDLVADVGTPPGDTMTDNQDFLIPGKVYESVFVGLQPSRSADGDIVSSYHDQSQYPHHQYVAFYAWLKDVFQADVVIHVGTHGTLEFLKGKEMAISGRCTPDELIADLPHLYLYYIGNPSEAMIAKRRSLATVVSYQTPPYTTGDLYEDYVELEDLLANYEEAKRLDPKRTKALLNEIEQKASELNFTSSDIHDLEMELYRMKRSLIPKGLHVFNEGYKKEDAKAFMTYCVRYDRDDVRSLKRLIAEDRGMDFDQVLADEDVAIRKELDRLEGMVVDGYIANETIDPAIIKQEGIRTQCVATMEYALMAYKGSMNTFEGRGLLTGLNGKYLPVRLASDIVKNPEILPSGYNLYQFDPRQIPEKTAVQRGEEIARNTIRHYYKENGSYPVSTGVVLWGFETSRTQGETIGQILSYLGVRVKPSRGGFEPKYEIIPLEEMDRPRLDVVIHMTGFFRDIFPNVLDKLNDVIHDICLLDEDVENNYVKANYLRIKEKMLAEGYDDEDAETLAAARIFGPKEGAYSTRLTGIIEGGHWQEEQELADGYMRDIQYIYAPGFRGEASMSLLQAQLEAVDIVSQIRSNHEYEVTDLDHYYEFFGGFQKAIELERGEKVPVLISDTTKETVLTENVKQSIERGVRTRLLNPKWIDGLMEHEYHGTHKILARFENLIGLSATTNEVDSWVFSDLHKTFVQDEKRRKQLQADNPWAYHNMMERLFESHKRGYWNATEEELEQLRDVYLQIEGSIEEQM